MTTFVALLRAVNVGGTGKLPMADLRALCEAAGFRSVRTYIASGNVVFDGEASEAEVKALLERRLHDLAGRAVGVMVRTGPEMAAILARNPFADRAPNRTVAIFLDRPPPQDLLERLSGRVDEEVALGTREVYVHYGETMGRSTLRLPGTETGTARNMNTVATLRDMVLGTRA